MMQVQQYLILIKRVTTCFIVHHKDIAKKQLKLNKKRNVRRHIGSLCSHTLLPLFSDEFNRELKARNFHFSSYNRIIFILFLTTTHSQTNSEYRHTADITKLDIFLFSNKFRISCIFQTKYPDLTKANNS